MNWFRNVSKMLAYHCFSHWNSKNLDVFLLYYSEYEEEQE